MCVKKYFPLIGAAIILGIGTILHFAYGLSDKAAWSYIVSSVNLSAWELYKPFGYAYIFFIIIELSYLRPSLIDFICSKLIGMYVLCCVILSGAMLIHLFSADVFIFSLVVSAIGVILAQIIGYKLYNSDFKKNYFIFPLIVSLFAMIFLLLILSFYPPHWGIFYDFYSGGFGRYV